MSPPTDYGEVVHLVAGDPAPSVLLVCEHASNRIPQAMCNLGLADTLVNGHIAWDPGALGVARAMADQMSAVLVSGGISRLVYDCNRPPEADSAVPVRSEIHDITGNMNLSAGARAERVTQVYTPFRRAVADQIARHRSTLKLMVTVHSFTPVYKGVARAVELGVLHGTDTRVAEAMMDPSLVPDGYDVRLNEPYAAKDGVAHTLDLHGPPNALPNVMLEIRNDLIATPDAQDAMADVLVAWIAATRARLPGQGGGA